MEKMKAVVFDFDGTLTKKDQNIWKMLWQKMGYPVDSSSLYAKLYVSHVIMQEITRKQWFDKTCEAYQKHGMRRENLEDVSKNISLIDGFGETIRTLKENGYKLYIVSGCIKETIEMVLGKYTRCFDRIESNRCVFDELGLLKALVPTDYDFGGKAKFIEELKSSGINAKDIVFVGNSDNDEWAHLSGCKTICINPDKADKNDSTKWHVVRDGVKNLTEILPDILAQTAGQNPEQKLNY